MCNEVTAGSTESSIIAVIDCQTGTNYLRELSFCLNYLVIVCTAYRLSGAFV